MQDSLLVRHGCECTTTTRNGTSNRSVTSRRASSTSTRPSSSFVKTISLSSVARSFLLLSRGLIRLRDPGLRRFHLDPNSEREGIRLSQGPRRRSSTARHSQLYFGDCSVQSRENRRDPRCKIDFGKLRRNSELDFPRASTVRSVAVFARLRSCSRSLDRDDLSIL